VEGIADINAKKLCHCHPMYKCTQNNQKRNTDKCRVLAVSGGSDSWNTLVLSLSLLYCSYPVILQQFSLNRGSGGKGRYDGGDGVVREMLFRKSLTLSVLSERRVHPPYGLHGSDLCQFTNIVFV